MLDRLILLHENNKVIAQVFEKGDNLVVPRIGETISLPNDKGHIERYKVKGIEYATDFVDLLDRSNSDLYLTGVFLTLTKE